MALAATLLRFVDERLDHMLEAPQLWGADESVELQILQLLEIRLLIAAQRQGPEDWRQVQLDYERFLAEQLPGSPPITLTARLGAERRGELWSLLAAFVAMQRQQHLVRAGVDQNLEQIQAIDRLLAAARADWEAEQDRRDTYGSKPVRLTIEAA
ncbi:MAG: hypothetical protein E6J90_01830 [Deltaproteobacteria bacterium]|nr:MAG: hypothetical protein E6J91_14910 [Deltaproteobacteria bacterium]TMQ27779.1 MAG: hypothetical protein E6J90_01830 [Deltaproteobacteria bacterium]